jgi:hypothetical protein
MRVRVSPLVFVVCLCATASAHALKQPLGPEFNISNPSTEGGGVVSAAADSHTGRYFVVWTAGRASKLVGRLIDRDGEPLTQEIGISDAVLSYVSPVVTYNAGLRQYLVVWGGVTCCTPYRHELRAQRVSASGDKIGGVIALWSGFDLFQPSVACSSRSGACLVAWPATFPTSGTRARLIDPGGLPVGPEVLLTTDGGISTAVGYAPEADRYLVAWSEIAGVRGRMLDSAASPIGAGSFEISSAGGYGPVLAYNAANREFGVLFGHPSYPPYSSGFPYVAVARVGQDGNVTSAGIFSRGKIEGASIAFDSRERAYLAAWGRADETHGVGAFLSPNLAPIASADFAGGYQVAYNAAADEYLLVKGSCSVPGLLVAVCGRRVGTSRGAVSDRTSPRLRLTFRRLQRIVRQRGVVLRARCDEVCQVRASARIGLTGASRTLKLRPAVKTLRPGVKKRLKLRATKTTLRKLRRAFKHRSRLKVRLTATATDSSGNRTIAKRKLRARR